MHQVSFARRAEKHRSYAGNSKRPEVEISFHFFVSCASVCVYMGRGRGGLIGSRWFGIWPKGWESERKYVTLLIDSQERLILIGGGVARSSLLLQRLPLSFSLSPPSLLHLSSVFYMANSTRRLSSFPARHFVFITTEEESPLSRSVESSKSRKRAGPLSGVTLSNDPRERYTVTCFAMSKKKK